MFCKTPAARLQELLLRAGEEFREHALRQTSAWLVKNDLHQILLDPRKGILHSERISRDAVCEVLALDEV